MHAMHRQQPYDEGWHSRAAFARHYGCMLTQVQDRTCWPSPLSIIQCVPCCLLRSAMRLYRSTSLGLLLLLALQVCSSAEAAPTGSSTWQRTHLPGSFPDIPGLDAEALYNSNPIDAVAAYKDCREHGAACKTPCPSISNCAGCYPGSDGSSTVCGFCLPGHYMSADQKSCLPCKESTFSTGGRAASCTLCPDGQTSKAGAASCSGGKQTPAQQGELYLPAGIAVQCSFSQSVLAAQWASCLKHQGFRLQGSTCHVDNSVSHAQCACRARF